jgi:hypothetical protein
MPNTTKGQKRLQVPEETEKKDKRDFPAPPTFALAGGGSRKQRGYLSLFFSGRKKRG